MEFIFKGNGCRQFFEFGRMKKVETINIAIGENIYKPNTSVNIQNGSYNADVIVIYSDGAQEIIKKQKLEINGKDKKVILDMMGVHMRLLNLFVNIRWLYIVIAVVILATLFGDIGLIIATALGLGLFYAGNDYVLKRKGFANTFRAKFKNKMI